MPLMAKGLKKIGMMASIQDKYYGGVCMSIRPPKLH